MGTSQSAGAKGENEKIVLTLLNGTGYVFEAEDYIRLRRECRIVGALVGTCSTRGWSVNDCTLPVELTTCETRLLVEEGIAVLVSKKQSLLRSLAPSELAEHQQQMELRISAQAQSLKEEKLRESERNIDKIVAGKRRKLLKAGQAAEDIKIDPVQLLREIGESVTFERKNALLDIPCAHPEPHLGQVVRFQSSDTSLKYLVFRDFWMRGKYVTAGDTFGGDFLIYPGDPMLYHASHIVILLEEPSIKPLDLIAKVRLSVMVNKHCVFAYLERGSGESGLKPTVRYQTVLWEGNRDKERLISSAQESDL